MNELSIISVEERLSEDVGLKIVVAGVSGVGKTSLLWTLPADETLMMDLEAGTLSIEGWSGDMIRPKTWQQSRDFACMFGGPNPSLKNTMPYSEAHYQALKENYKLLDLEKYKTIFVDSITIAARLCFSWCQNQEENISTRSGKIDTRAVYGMHGREMIAWLTQLQHIRNKNVIFVGILEEKVDDFNRTTYGLQMEGAKTSRELPGIVDEIITMAVMEDGNNEPYRAFVCTTLNPYGYPAKDRSGRLQTIEEPHLGRLMQKMVTQRSTPLSEKTLNHNLPKEEKEND